MIATEITCIGEVEEPRWHATEDELQALEDLGIEPDLTRCDACDEAIGPVLGEDFDGNERNQWIIVCQMSDGTLRCEDCS